MGDQDPDWRDMVVGDRMALDQDFGRRVEQSPFSRQEWGLVMTATEFHIENPGDDDRARIVADTSDVPAILPAFDDIGGGMVHPGGPDAGGSGLLDGFRDFLGLGGSAAADEETVEAAADLAEVYAAELQARLEDQGRWAAVREAARTD